MPDLQRRVLCITLRHFTCNGGRTLAVFGRIVAKKHPHAVGAPAALDVHRQHLRIFRGQPGWLRGRGGGQVAADAVFGQLVHDPVQPAEVVLSFFRLKLCPGENRQRDHVDVRLAE